jgi:gamma-glutamyltranspeptidase / glutathione hydrolase
MIPARPTLYGFRHAVSTGHYLATAAAFSILESGGNAIDAGCCAGIALGVLFPDQVSPAGIAPIMIRTVSGQVVTIDGVGHWPSAIRSDLFMREHNGLLPTGVLLTVVPAAPDAWITALRDWGTLSFGDVAGAAIRFARDGFPVHDYLAAQIALYESEFRRWASSAAIFLPDNRPPNVGERFRQVDLATTLQYMVDEERSASGGGRVAGLEAARRAFYWGDIAARIVAHQQENGGYLSREDLSSFASRYEVPVRGRWRNYEIITCGPWCQGPMLIQALRMLEHTDLRGLTHNDADYIHVVTEIFKAAFSDREHRFGDPRFVDVGLEELLSDRHVLARIGAIDRVQAMPDMPPALGGAPAAKQSSLNQSPGQPPPSDTSFLCVVDRWGNAISATPSDMTFNAPVVPGTGLVPSTRGSQSRPDPHHPSGVAPGKRPRVTPNPAMVVSDDGTLMAFGSPAGDMQVQAMLQVLLNVFHFGMDLQTAIEAPRFGSFSFPNSFAPFTHLPGRLNVEDRIPDAVLSELTARGHDVEKWPSLTRQAGAVEAIVADPTSQLLKAGADPRQPAYAIVI